MGSMYKNIRISIKHILDNMQAHIEDDRVRHRFISSWTFRILAVVSFFMTIINISTHEYVLMVATLAFSIVCIKNTVLFKLGKKWEKIAIRMFSFEIISLFTFFIISGIPEGFSSIWICLLPTCGILMFGRRNGSILCAIMMIIIIFFLWTEPGRMCLQYQYTNAFMLRFPVLFCSFYIVEMFLETIRLLTQKKLVWLQNEYRYLYLHDALTGLYNRYGFNQVINEKLSKVQETGMALMILDLDYFKKINDTYGHNVGDVVLCEVAQKLSEVTCGIGTACRWGGEEFAILLNNCDNAENAAKNICCEIEAMNIKLDENIINITGSIGLAIAKKNCKINSSQLVLNADQCMYEAKQNGRNCVVCRKCE